MVRLDKLSAAERKMLIGGSCPSFDTNPFVAGPPLNQRRVAIITTAGLHGHHDRPFLYDDADFYRVIPGDIQASDLVMSHFSVGFDRSGFQRDCNVVFPIDRLREMAAEGVIGSLANFHYSFRSRNAREDVPAPIREIAGLLKKDKVNAVLLFPV
jgi:D-proline reductase (dithiol) PrdB